MNQAGKWLLITGAASGIGAATARLFVKNGWAAGLADVDEAGLNQLAAELGAAHCLPLAVDVRVPEDWDRALMRLGERSGGRLDLLVNNAGIFAAGALKDMELSKIQHLIDVNLMGVIHGVRATHPMLSATDGAQVVNIASFLALSGAGRGAVYSATKAAVHNLTEALASELRYDGIAVSDILPGFAATGFFTGGVRRITLGAALRDAGVRFIQPDQVAAAIFDATLRYRLHRTVGRQAKLLAAIARLSPTWAHSAVRRNLKAVDEGRLLERTAHRSAGYPAPRWCIQGAIKKTYRGRLSWSRRS